MRGPHGAIGLPDLTADVQPALAISPRIGEVVGDYCDGNRFYFADEQVADIGAAMDGDVLVRSGAGWTQRSPTRAALTRSIIHSHIHYTFPEDWRWALYDASITTHAGQVVRRVPALLR